MSKINIILAAGGTGGHIFPAQAMAEKLMQSEKFNPILICDDRTAKFIHASLAKIERLEIKASNLSGNVVAKLLGMLKLLLGIAQVFCFFLRKKPKAVIGFGGYPSFPTIIAALILSIPVVIHEQNAVMGRVNRFFAPLVQKIAVSFPETKGIKEQQRHKVIHTGNPVRQTIIEAKNAKHSSRQGKFGILVIGGSQGAQIFSNIIPAALKLLPLDIQSNLNVTQQARPNLLQQTKEAYSNTPIFATVETFFQNIAELLIKNDLVIARAGAATIVELSMLSKPSVLIPFAQAKDNHQYYNALYLKQNEATILLEEPEMTPEKLSEILAILIKNPKKLKTMGKKANELAVLKAVENLYQVLYSLVL